MSETKQINQINQERFMSMINKQEYELLDDKYVILNLLGSGYTSDVFVCYGLLEKQFYAAKIFKEKTFEKINHNFKTELDSMISCDHTNILKIINFKSQGKKAKLKLRITDDSYLIDKEELLEKNFQDKSKIENFLTTYYKTYSIKQDIYYFCLELCEKMELFDYVFYSKAGIGEDIARVFFKRILNGIDYLHNEKNIAHRDIKTENLFLNDDFEVKIGDFGFSKIMSTDSKFTKTSLGTPGYEAPEVIEGKFYIPKAYDMFSLGIVLFTITYGFPPFKEARKNDSHYRYVAYNKKDVFWEKHSKRINPSTSFKNLIDSLIDYDFNTRATVKDVFNSLWLNEKEGLVEEENAINKLKSLYPSICKAKAESIETMTVEKNNNDGCNNNMNYQYRNIETNMHEEFEHAFTQEDISSLKIDYLCSENYTHLIEKSKFKFKLNLPAESNEINEDPNISILKYIYLSIKNIAELITIQINEKLINVEINYCDDTSYSIKVFFNIEISYYDPNFIVCFYPSSNISLFSFNDLFEKIKNELRSLID